MRPYSLHAHMCPCVLDKGKTSTAEMQTDEGPTPTMHLAVQAILEAKGCITRDKRKQQTNYSSVKRVTKRRVLRKIERR